MTSGVCARASRAISVLFVDDDADTLFAYRLLATEEGVTAEVARDGREALELASLLLPDVIVLDVGLRSSDCLDGYEVARRLRASSSTGDIPILIVSGYDSARDQAEMQASGCDRYLAKPCSPEALFGLVRELASKRKAQCAASPARASTA